MINDTIHHSNADGIRVRKRAKKPYEKLIWIANSTAILFSAFWVICLTQDILVWLIGKLIGLPLLLEFDYMSLPPNSTFSSSQILIITTFVPIMQVIIAIAAGVLYRQYRLKKSLFKLFFLWTQYLALSILGGSFITSFADEGGPIRVLWTYLGMNTEFLPMISFFIATGLLFLGIQGMWKFLNISPSSEINKVFSKRLEYIVCVQIIPLLILFTLGMVLYPNLRINSRLYSALMIWVPVLAGIVACLVRNDRFSKVPAFKDSHIRIFQPLWLGFAALLYVGVFLLS